MKKILILLVSAVFLFSACNKQETPAVYDIPEFNDWSLTFTDFEEFANAEEYDGFSLPGYKFYKYSDTTVFGYDAELVYQFTSNGELKYLYYFIPAKDMDKTYDRICKAVTEKLGEADKIHNESTIWDKDNIYLWVDKGIKTKPNHIMILLSPSTTDSQSETASS